MTTTLPALLDIQSDFLENDETFGYNDRGEMYLRTHIETSVTTLLVYGHASVLEGNIATFSGLAGGAAFLANYVLADRSAHDPSAAYQSYSMQNNSHGTNDIFTISQLVAQDYMVSVIDDFNEPGGNGFRTNAEGIVSARQSWENFGMEDQFPGQVFEVFGTTNDVIVSAVLPTGIFANGGEDGENAAWSGVLGSILFGKSVEDFSERYGYGFVSGPDPVPVIFDSASIQNYVLHYDPQNFGSDGIGLAGDRNDDGIMNYEDGMVVMLDTYSARVTGVIWEEIVESLLAIAATSYGDLAAATTAYDLDWESFRNWQLMKDFRAQLSEGGEYDFEKYAYLNGQNYQEQDFWGMTEYLLGDAPGLVRNMVFYYDRNLTGTQGNDFLSTGAGEDILIGGDGDDLLRGGWGADHLYGGNDNDILIGENGDDHLDGQNGNDVLFGAYGTDVVSGGAGNDLFFAHASVTGLDGDIYDGDSGTDTLDYSYVDYTYGLTIDLSNTQGTATDSFYFTDYVIEIENIAATHQSDWITGSSSSNVFAGLEGDDIFYASSGKDVYHGGYTDAEMQNFWEHDLQDIDRINDGDEDTVNYLGMTGVAFEVTLIDAALKNYWVDKYYSGTLYSGTWDRDILFSIELLDIDIGYRHDAGGAVHMGDSGNNIMNYINLGGGNYNVPYSFYGYGGIDTLWGGVKNDLLVGGTGDDILSGNDGNDTYFYSLGDGNDNLNDGGTNGDIDTILFGFGINPWEVSLGRYHTDKMTITFADQSYITVDNQNSNGFGIDYIEFMDGTTWDMQGTLVTVYGTGGNDNLSGTTESAYREGSLIHDVIYAGGGNDYVNGHGGNDTIYGGDGNDVTLHGGYGEDVIYGEDGDDTINGGHDDDILYGGIGVDTINGGEDEDIIYGDAGNDILKGDNHDDIVYGGEGDDTINGGNGVDSLYGDADNDTINGDNGNDIIYGGGGNDTLIGGTADAGNDILVGDDGNDTLNGYNGADTLYGGAGIDTMTGGLGADTFMFESASAFSNIDTITDFKQSDNDKLDISDILEGYYNYGVDVITDFVQITQSGTTAYLSINQSGSGGGSYTQIATLTGLGTQNLTDEAALEASGRLITHVV